MDQFAGPGAFVAAHELTGGPVADSQGGQAVALEDPVGGGGCDARTDDESQRAYAVLAPHRTTWSSTAAEVR